MNQQSYKMSAFEQLLLAEGDSGVRPLFDESAVEIRGDGVHTDSGTWTPCLEIPGVDPLESPSLPLPFTAGHLAAFLIDGPGSFIREFYGAWSDGPDHDRLELISERGVMAKQALREAFAAYREAESAVGPLDASAEARAEQLGGVARALEAQVRREVGRDGLAASEPLQQARAASRQARQEADAAFADWRRRMVQHLLTEPAAPETPPAPAMEQAARASSATVQQAIAPYVADVMRSHQNFSADNLYQYFRQHAGKDGSPFSRLAPGGELFCIDAGKSCGRASVTAALTAYRKQARGSKSLR